MVADSKTEHKHEWVEIGETTASGDSWMQAFHVYHCACGTYGTAHNPHAFYDYKRRPATEVTALREKEEVDYRALLDEHRADPEGVVARHRQKKADRDAYVKQLIAKEKAKKGGEA